MQEDGSDSVAVQVSGREESGRMEVTVWQFRLVGEGRAGGWK